MLYYVQSRHLIDGHHCLFFSFISRHAFVVFPQFSAVNILFNIFNQSSIVPRISPPDMFFLLLTLVHAFYCLQSTEIIDCQILFFTGIECAGNVFKCCVYLFDLIWLHLYRSQFDIVSANSSLSMTIGGYRVSVGSWKKKKKKCFVLFNCICGFKGASMMVSNILFSLTFFFFFATGGLGIIFSSFSEVCF